MVPVADRPLLEHIIDALQAAGISDITLVVGANRERVQSHFEDGTPWGLDISYVVQDAQLGTGHALLQAESTVGSSFIALNGDRIISPELVTSVKDRHEETGDTVVSITQVDTPSQYGVVEVADETVVNIEEQPHPSRASSNFINAGVYAFKPSIFSAIRQTDSHGEQALTDTLSTLTDEQTLQAVRYRGRWLDVSEPWDLLEVNNAVLSEENRPQGERTNIDKTAAVADKIVLSDGVTVHPQAAIRAGVTVCENVSIGAGAVIENSILLPDVTLNPGAVVKDCIVGANATIGANTTIEGGVSNIVLKDTVHRNIQFGGLIGDNTTIGANVTIDPGTLIGNEVSIESGSTVSDTIEDTTHIRRG
jgi:glucose-1-phosphate thymidylyltransferase